MQLTENRRQIDAWERHTLDDLRDGDVDRALDDYANRGRITISASVEEQRESVVGAW